MNKFALIMAGGGGTRFWPLSREGMPKQFLNLSGGDAMINETAKRIEPAIPLDMTYIAANRNQKDVMNRILIKSLPRENILYEPLAKNTAPCILYAALRIYRKHGDGVLCVFAADHHISDAKGFLDTLNLAAAAADKSGRAVTIGIKPTFPSTGYGYIKRGAASEYEGAYEVDRFVEKPGADRAREYTESGGFFWNSGMFVWKISTVLALYEKFLPDMRKAFADHEDKLGTPDEGRAVEEIFSGLNGISVDYGIMERVNDALIVPGDFGWNDVGSWDTLGAAFDYDRDGNIVKANHMGIDTEGSVIYGKDRLIATIGLNNAVIVDTGDAVLVCSKDRVQDVKLMVEKLRGHGMGRYL